MFRHFRQSLIIGIQDGSPGARYGLDDHPLDGGQLPQRGDLLQPDVVARDVQDDRDIVRAVAESLAQNAAASHLEDGEVDARILEHHACRARATGIRLLDEAAVDVDPVGGRHPHLVAKASDDVGDDAGGRRLAIRAGDGDDRDAGRGSLGEEQVDDRFRDVLRLALGRVRVHPKTRSGVHLDDGPAGLPDRLADVGR